MTHGPWLQRTHNLLRNTLHKQITSRPQTFTKCLPWAMKHHAGRWTRQYVIIDHLIILHGSAQTAQLWAESITRAVGWDRRMLHGLPHHTRALLSSECRHLVLEPVLVGLPYHGGSQEESARMVSSKEQVLARDEPVPALSSAPPDTCWARRKGHMMTWLSTAFNASGHCIALYQN